MWLHKPKPHLRRCTISSLAAAHKMCSRIILLSRSPGAESSKTPRLKISLTMGVGKQLYLKEKQQALPVLQKCFLLPININCASYWLNLSQLVFIQVTVSAKYWESKEIVLSWSPKNDLELRAIHAIMALYSMLLHNLPYHRCIQKVTKL